MLKVRRCWLIVALCLPFTAVNADDDTLYLELIINQMVTDAYIFTRYRDGELWLQPQPLRELTPRLPIPEGEWVAASAISADFEYQRQQQRLMVTLAPNYLPASSIGAGYQVRDYTFGRSMLLNYDVFAQDNRASSLLEQDDAVSLGAQASLDAKYDTFALRHEHLYRNRVGDRQSNHVRLDTSAWYQDYNGLFNVGVGDHISSASWSARAFRMGGLFVGRDYSLRPDLITFPTPQFANSAALPSTAELFIDGMLTAQGEIPAGPFNFNQRPYISGAGTATIVTTDVFGRVVTTDQPFYITEQLLAPGFSDYGISVGRLRRNYGQQSFDYASPMSTVGYFRYGVSERTTLGSNIEWQSGVQVFGVEAQRQLGLFGVAAASWRRSVVDGNINGDEHTISYRYDARHWSLAARHLERSHSFQDIIDFSEARSAPRRSSQVVTSVRLRDYGSLSLAWFSLTADQDRSSDLLTLSFSPRIRARWTLLLSANKELTSGTYSAAATISINLSGTSHGSMSLASDNANDVYGRLQVSHGNSQRRGLSWTASQTVNQRQEQTQFVANYRHEHAEGYVGAFGASSRLQPYAGLRGSVVLAHGQAFASAPIYQAFAIVDTDGEANVPVYVSNLYSGRTNRNGYFIATNLMSNIDNRVHIDPLELDFDMQPERFEAWVRPAGNVGVPVRFSMQTNRQRVVRIVLPSGEPIAFRSRVQGPDQTLSVGYDGETMLPEAWLQQRLMVEQADGGTCYIAPNDAFERVCHASAESGGAQ